jgi:acetylornithine deacetylase
MSFDPIDFLEQAVQIPSDEDVSPMRNFLVETLNDEDIENYIDDAGNIIATRGTGSPHVVLNTHIDTVSPHIGYRREEDRIHGRGACDAKGCLASLLTAFLNINPSSGKVTLAVTPDEETLSTGADALDLNGDAYIIGEPTGLDVCNAAKGRFQGTITVHGSSAHAAEPEEGLNVMDAMCNISQALKSFNNRPDTPNPHPELGSPTLTPTTFEGGEATNQVPAEAEIVVDRRSVPPETSEEFERKLTQHLREEAPSEFSIDFSLTERETPFLEAFETPEANQLVRSLQTASGGEIRPFTAASEASYFAKQAPTVIFGPGHLADEEGAVAHSEREYVLIKEVRAAADAVEESISAVLTHSSAIAQGTAD